MDSFITFIKDYQIIISSAVAIGSTFFIVYSNRKTTAMTNATNVIREISQDKLIQEGLGYIRNWKKDHSTTAIDCLDSDCDGEFKDKKAAILHVLNQYEKLSVGINNRIYSEKVIKESSAGTIIHLFNVTEPFIKSCRNSSNRKTIWQELEQIAKKWENKPLKVKKAS